MTRRSNLTRRSRGTINSEWTRRSKCNERIKWTRMISGLGAESGLVLLYIADPGKASGCSTNTLMIDYLIESLSKSTSSSIVFIVPPYLNGQR